MKPLIDRFVDSEISKMSLKDKMTSFLVKKKKRGTYQALNECSKFEAEVIQDVKRYMGEWLINELIDGSLKKSLIKEIKSQVLLELSSKGFTGIIRD